MALSLGICLVFAFLKAKFSCLSLSSYYFLGSNGERPFLASLNIPDEKGIPFDLSFISFDRACFFFFKHSLETKYESICLDDQISHGIYVGSNILKLSLKESSLVK